MKRAVVVVVASIAIGAIVLVTAVYGVSEWHLRRSYDAPLVQLRPQHAVDTAEGRRMAIIVGCWAGCHGQKGEGGTTTGIKGVVRHTAPALSNILPAYTDAELTRLIRYGVKRNGQSAVGMISYTFWPMSDEDLANIIAHLRAQPSVPPMPRHVEIQPRGRVALALGRWKVSAAQVDRTIPRWGELPQRTAFERGRYLASITCSECHGLDFRGNPLEGGPSLVVATTYTPEKFRHLLRTGEPISGRDLGIMSRVARNAFSHFTDEEISDVYTFLRTYHAAAANIR